MEQHSKCLEAMNFWPLPLPLPRLCSKGVSSERSMAHQSTAQITYNGAERVVHLFRRSCSGSPKMEQRVAHLIGMLTRRQPAQITRNIQRQLAQITYRGTTGIISWEVHHAAAIVADHLQQNNGRLMGCSSCSVNCCRSPTTEQRVLHGMLIIQSRVEVAQIICRTTSAPRDTYHALT